MRSDDNVFMRSYTEEIRRILPWPNNAKHPINLPLEELAKGRDSAYRLAEDRKGELDALGGWNDAAQDNPTVGAAMGLRSAALSLVDAFNHACNVRSSEAPLLPAEKPKGTGPRR